MCKAGAWGWNLISVNWICNLIKSSCSLLKIILNFAAKKKTILEI